MLRVFMQKKRTEWKMKLMEAGMCALLFVGATVLQILFKWPSEAAILIGVLIGFLGSEQIKAFMVKLGYARAESVQ